MPVAAVGLVVANYTGWWGARNIKRAVLTAVPKPYWFRSSWMEVVLALSVIGACALFIWQNPFAVLHPNWDTTRKPPVDVRPSCRGIARRIRDERFSAWHGP